MRQTGHVMYVPLDGKPIRLTLGLRALDPLHWIEVDDERPAEMAAKSALLRERHSEVVATLPEGDAGSRECWNLLSAHVIANYPSLYGDIEYDGNDIVALTDLQTMQRIDVRTMHPVDACGRIVQEDVVIMHKRNGAWILAAASLCFPSRWRLSEKLGKDLLGIHGPVPGYAEQIGDPVDAMFDKFTADRQVWRLNWTLIDDAELYQPEPTNRSEQVLAAFVAGEDLGQLLHFRVERQTLTKLPQSGDVVFTIRTYVRPLAGLGGPEVYRDLATALRSAGPELIAYKGWGPLLRDTLAWLDERSGEPAR